MKIMVMSHADLMNQLVYGKVLDKHLLIVVQGDIEKRTASNVHLVGRLNLSFDDVETISIKQKFFTSDNAREILNFVNSKVDRVNCIIVACKDGFSCSTAIAGALGKIINYSEDCTNKSVFNSLVYLTILDEYLSNPTAYKDYSAIEFVRRLSAKTVLPMIEYKTLVYNSENKEKIEEITDVE